MTTNQEAAGGEKPAGSKPEYGTVDDWLDRECLRLRRIDRLGGFPPGQHRQHCALDHDASWGDKL